MNTIIVNGQRFQVSGKNIVVSNGSIIVDGNIVQNGLSGIVEIKFEGDLANLKADGSVRVNGSVSGNVDAGGSVKCSNVNGDVDAGGSVDCGNIQGDISAGGSVRYKK